LKRPGLVFRELPPGLPPIQTVLVWRRKDTSPALANFLASFTTSESGIKTQKTRG
jgi:hypothetical protein